MDRSIFTLVWLMIVLALGSQNSIARQNSDVDAAQEKARLKALMDRNSQTHAVVLMDSILCFSPAQWQKAFELVSEQWDSAWNEEMQSMTLRVWGSDRVNMIEEMKFDELKKLLNEKQVEALEDIGRLASVDFVDLLREDRAESLKDRLEKNKQALLQVTDLKLEELREVGGMSEKQAEIIRVARNGIVSKTADRWRAVIDAYKESPDEEEVQDRAMKLVRGSLLNQCTDEGVWRKTLEKVFSEQQLKKIRERESLRLGVVKKQFVNDMVIFWALDRCKLTSQQFSDLVEMISGHLSLDYGWEMLEAEKQMSTIPDEDFQKILNADQWKALKPIVRRLGR